MSKTGDEEDEDECFYESLDRIVSSSCSCSTSNSDSEDNDVDNDPSPNPNHNSNSDSPNYASDRPFPIPKFPMGVAKYDIWISEPSSVSERRSRLLREMGLSGDPALSRAKPGDDDHRVKSSGEFGRSASSDSLSRQEHGGGGVSGMVRSKSDGGDQCYGPSAVCSPSILSIHSVSAEASSFVNSHKNQNFVYRSRSGNSNGSPVADASSPNKPPSGKNCKRVDEIRSNSIAHNPNSNREPGNRGGGGEVEEGDLCCNGIDKVEDSQACTIRNLDDGKEFVVNEIKEDGTWDKLKEVGTGRQLTMEEFQMSVVGHSPIVQELMRRQNVEEGNKDGLDSNVNGGSGGNSKLKKRGSWLRSIKIVASSMTGQKERRSSDERDTSSEKGGRRSSSATDDSQDVSFHGPEKVKVRQYGKSSKEVTGLYKSQEIQAHNGSIWSIKFSLDGKYLASAGEDCVIHVWQVVETERKGDLLMEKTEDNFNFLFVANGSPEPTSMSPNVDNQPEKKRRGRSSISRKSVSLDQVMVPDNVFGLSEKPICSFQGHLYDVLDLSWSKSQVGYYSHSRFSGLGFSVFLSLVYVFKAYLITSHVNIIFSITFLSESFMFS